MRIEMIKELLSGGENIAVEFKQSKNKLNKDVFESVCAFLNRNGGNLFLGVDDDGNAVGIDKEEVHLLSSSNSKGQQILDCISMATA